MYCMYCTVLYYTVLYIHVMELLLLMIPLASRMLSLVCCHSIPLSRLCSSNSISMIDFWYPLQSRTTSYPMTLQMMMTNLLKLATMMGMGRVMLSVPQMQQMLATSLPGAVVGAMSP